MIPIELQQILEECGYVTIGELATAMGVTYKKVHRLVMSGELGAKNTSKPGAKRDRWVCHREDLLAFFGEATPEPSIMDELPLMVRFDVDAKGNLHARIDYPGRHQNKP